MAISGIHGDQVNRMDSPGRRRRPASTPTTSTAARGQRAGAQDPLPASICARLSAVQLANVGSDVTEERRDPLLFDNEHYVK